MGGAPSVPRSKGELALSENREAPNFNSCSSSLPFWLENVRQYYYSMLGKTCVASKRRELSWRTIFFGGSRSCQIGFLQNNSSANYARDSGEGWKMVKRPVVKGNAFQRILWGPTSGIDSCILPTLQWTAMLCKVNPHSTAGCSSGNSASRDVF
jgi:hypothetical protein